MERLSALGRMRIVARQLEPGELNYELIWLAVSLGSLAVSVAWLGLGLPWPHCLFHSLTGHPCLTCGATRSAMEFFHLHFLAACRWNPLVFVGLWGVTLFDIYAAIVLLFRIPPLRFNGLSSDQRKFARVAVIVLLGLNWIYLLSRPPGVF